MKLNPRHAWFRRIVALAVLVAVWEAAAQANLLNPLYLPGPSRIWLALAELFGDGRIWPHLYATFSAALGGLVGGWLFSAINGSPVTKFDLWSLLFAAIGAALFAAIWHVVRSRSDPVLYQNRRYR